MPEGDTIERTARALRPLLRRRRIDAVHRGSTLSAADSLSGRVVTDVEARGKHLLIHLDDGRILHSHLGMTGAWHIYRAEQRWHKPRRLATLAMAVGEHVVVCFSPKTIEILRQAELRSHAALGPLGPDLLDATLDTGEILHRFRAVDGRPIGEAVMNQSVISGIGNVYKSETLFLTTINPFVTVARLADEQIVRWVVTARGLLRRNLQGFPRRTRFRQDGPALWVYRRAGAPCLVCGVSIRMRRQGELGRSTYWCPQCQQGGTRSMPTPDAVLPRPPARRP